MDLDSVATDRVVGGAANDPDFYEAGYRQEAAIRFAA
jgi:hypothetical protein